MLVSSYLLYVLLFLITVCRLLYSSISLLLPIFITTSMIFTVSLIPIHFADPIRSNPISLLYEIFHFPISLLFQHFTFTYLYCSISLSHQNVSFYHSCHYYPMFLLIYYFPNSFFLFLLLFCLLIFLPIYFPTLYYFLSLFSNYLIILHYFLSRYCSKYPFFHFITTPNVIFFPFSPSSAFSLVFYFIVLLNMFYMFTVTFLPVSCPTHKPPCCDPLTR